MKIGHTLLTVLAMLLTSTISAQTLDFGRTLRVDYVFSGDVVHQEISVAEMSSFKGWAGRRNHLDSLLLRGNGVVTLRNAQTQKVLYKQSFSTLFQEWLTTEEATNKRRAFENVFLLPMPTDTAWLTVQLYGTGGRIMTQYTHVVAPSDPQIRSLDVRSTAPHRTLWQGGTPEKSIDIAFVAEGYTASESEAFYAHAEEAMKALFAHAPFDAMKSRFNVVAVALPSNESGVSIPQKGVWKETALDSHFNTFYSDRYLTTLHLKRLHDALAGIPYEHIVILANTDYYGGGGIFNSYSLTSSRNQSFAPVAVHEFGHSFGGLADEYFYDDQYSPYYFPHVEPFEPNITTLKDFSQKWSDMLPAGTAVPTLPTRANIDKIGVYEGAGYQSKGVYRPFQNCRMKTNKHPEFCAVCQRALRRMIDFYTK